MIVFFFLVVAYWDLLVNICGSVDKLAMRVARLNALGGGSDATFILCILVAHILIQWSFTKYFFVLVIVTQVFVLEEVESKK